MAVALRRQFTVNDYAKMRETGILTEDDRVELIDGESYVMSPLEPRHMALANRLNKLRLRAVQDDAVISPQNAVQLDDYTEPQPDIALLHPREDDYKHDLPRPAEVFLLIEIADTSLDYDRDFKLPCYAMSHIPEVWIVDVKQQMIEQYTQPFEVHCTIVKKHFQPYNCDIICSSYAILACRALRSWRSENASASNLQDEVFECVPVIRSEGRAQKSYQTRS